MEIYELTSTYREAIDAYIGYLWSGPMMVTKGKLFDSRTLPGFVAVGKGALLGFLLYRMDDTISIFILPKSCGFFRFRPRLLHSA